MGLGLNRAMLLGNLCADPVLRYTQGGHPVLNFRLATNESYFDKKSNTRKERVDFHNLVMWGKRAESLVKILKRGTRCYVEGPVRTSSYEDKEGAKRYKTEINVTDIRLCGDAGGNGQGAARGHESAGPPQEPQAGDYPDGEYGDGGGGDDNIPF
jgi:single-strand DNA-binding protein